MQVEAMKNILAGMQSFSTQLVMAEDDAPPEMADEFTRAVFDLISEFLEPYADRITGTVDLMEITSRLAQLLEKVIALKEKQE